MKLKQFLDCCTTKDMIVHVQAYSFFQVVNSVIFDQCTDYMYVENQKYSKVILFYVNIQILSICEST